MNANASSVPSVCVMHEELSCFEQRRFISDVEGCQVARVQTPSLSNHTTTTTTIIIIIIIPRTQTRPTKNETNCS